MSDEQPPLTRRAARAPKAAKTRTVPSAGAARRRRKIVLGVALGTVFVLLGTGAVFAGLQVGSANATPVPTVEPTPEPDPRTVPATTADPFRLRTCSVADAASAEVLGAFQGQVIDVDSGQVLFDRDGDTAVRPGGVMESLTAATALAVLGPTFQISTRVMDGADEGTVVLVGRGDPTLSRLPAGEESVYAGAPKLADLAAQVVEAYGQKHPDEPLKRLELDATYWGLDDRWDDTWDRGAQTGGAQAEVVALQVDGDRDDPTAQNSPRSSGPIGRAGDAFAQALKDADTEGVVIDEGIEIETGEAPGGTDLLGEVRSQPLRQLIPQMLQTGDSSLAESLARIASKESDRDGSAASLTETYTAALGPSGFDTEGLAVRDGSGLSAENAITPSALAEFMSRIHGGDQNLQIIRDALPVSGESGGLADRFTGDNAEAQGDVTGLAGRIASAATLAGTVEAADGASLAFAFAGVQDGIDDGAVAALDTLATAVYRCGSNLSSN